MRHPPIWLVCPQCQKNFKCYVSQNRKFCSRECKAEAERVGKVPFKIRKGYRVIYVGRDHPMSDGEGNAYEHRIVMAEHLGRPLERHEHIHHLNEIKTDNRIENLELIDLPSHISLHRQIDRWALDHECCVECSTTERPHAGAGKCRRCYNRAYARSNRAMAA